MYVNYSIGVFPAQGNALDSNKTLRDLDDQQVRMDGLLALSDASRQHPSDRSRTEIAASALDAIDSFVVPLGNRNSMQEGVCTLASKTLDSLDIQVALKEGPEKGLSGSPVFLIEDHQKNLKLVIKVFSTRTEFLREVYGINLLQRQNISSINSVKVVEAGVCQIDSQEYMLLAMSAAEDTLLVEYVQAIAKAHKGNREELVHTAAKATYIFGKCLGQLHTAKTEKNDIPVLFDSWINRDYQSGLGKLVCKKSHGIDLEKLERRITCAWNRVKQEKVTIGLVHFDANPNNVFVNSSAAEITLIDVSTMHMGYGTHNRPLGLLAYDFIHARLQLEFRMRKYGLSEEEQNRINGELTKGYVNSGARLPSQDEEIIFVAWEGLRVIGKFWDQQAIDADRLQRVGILVEKLKATANQ